MMMALFMWLEVMTLESTIMAASLMMTFLMKWMEEIKKKKKKKEAEKIALREDVLTV